MTKTEIVEKMKNASDEQIADFLTNGIGLACSICVGGAVYNTGKHIMNCLGLKGLNKISFTIGNSIITGAAVDFCMERFNKYIETSVDKTATAIANAVSTKTETPAEVIADLKV